MEYPVVLERDETGGVVAYCPTLKGCVSQGETEEEALENIKDAIVTYLQSLEDLKKIRPMDLGRREHFEVPADGLSWGAAAPGRSRGSWATLHYSRLAPRIVRPDSTVP